MKSSTILLSAALQAAALWAALLTASIPVSAQTASPAPTPAALPDAPTPASTEPTQSSVHGQVLFADGAPADGAVLTLTPTSGPALQYEAEADGTFVFIQVPPGPFTLQVAADGFLPVSTTATLDASDALTLPALTLRMPTVVTSVNAISEKQEAELEVRQEESQRILGAIPNFFVSYVPNPVPLSSAQKFRLSLRTMIDPVTIGVSAAIAGGQQLNHSYPGFGTGPEGYGRRFGANLANSSIGIMLTGAMLPSVFRQDPRYFYKGTGSTRSRIGWVAKQTIEQRGDNGHWQFGWSNVLGNVGAALISTTYYPKQNDSLGKLTGENFGLSILSQAIANTLQEFVFGHITTHHTP